MDLMRPGRAYSRYVPFVGTTLFHWFLPSEGNVMGPWQPIGGRSSWDGGPDFWAGQIKQIMMANIDAVYVHCINNFEPQRVNFFKACNQLRREGWEIPKIAPFLDPFYLWREKPIDVRTTAGKDEYTRHYIRFFDQYFSENQDSFAESGLLHVDGKITLTSWWVYSMLQNLEALTRDDVERRLMSALRNRMPSLKQGIYMMSAALIDPDYTFSDERMIMFSGYTYALHCVHHGMDVWHVQPGYWDQNIRQPGYHLPRDGGKNYRNAWEIVVNNQPYVRRVYVESWNEYDEGSGIYASDPAPPYVNQNMHSNTDVFSTDNDPFEYINTTARGAARINGRPDNDATVLGVEAPPSASSGSEVSVRVVVRNEGNARWTGRGGYALHLGADVIVPIDDQADEIPLYGGIFRGRAVVFKAKLPVGNVRGAVDSEISMIKDGVSFGEKAIIRIEIQ
jgi:hypothetical protein